MSTSIRLHVEEGEFPVDEHSGFVCVTVDRVTLFFDSVAAIESLVQSLEFAGNKLALMETTCASCGRKANTLNEFGNCFECATAQDQIPF